MLLGNIIRLPFHWLLFYFISYIYIIATRDLSMRLVALFAQKSGVRETIRPRRLDVEP
jgi:hypothetical protein